MCSVRHCIVNNITINHIKRKKEKFCYLIEFRSKFRVEQFFLEFEVIFFSVQLVCLKFISFAFVRNVINDKISFPTRDFFKLLIGCSCLEFNVLASIIDRRRKRAQTDISSVKVRNTRGEIVSRYRLTRNYERGICCTLRRALRNIRCRTSLNAVGAELVTA